MQNVSFHIQSKEDKIIPEHFMCIILEQYVMKYHKVCVMCNDEKQSKILSNHIWSFPTSWFMPHKCKDNMIITEGFFKHKSVINMSKNPVLNIKTQIIELVFNDEQSINEARDRFKIYKTNGFKLTHIKEDKFQCQQQA